MIDAGGAKAVTGFQLMSPAFRESSSIPPQYTCKGQGVSPPLNILHCDPSAKSLALIMHDPDAPVGDYTHWLMWDIATSTETIAANSVPVGAVQGTNSNNKLGYMGPCPPSGQHRYMFELYCLDTSLGLESGSSRRQLEEALEGHVLASHTLTGMFAADS